MKHSDFDEVMIVNPGLPGFDTLQGDAGMAAYYGGFPGFGIYAAEDDMWDGPLGSWLGEEDDLEGVGLAYADPDWGFAGFADPMSAEYDVPATIGYPIADPGMLGFAPGFAGPAPGWVGDGIYGPPMGSPYQAYGMAPPAGYAFADPWGEFAYADEWDGYGAEEFDDYDDALAEDEVGFDADEIDGYVRDVPPTFNPVVAAAANINGLGDDLDGYVRPENVNATVTGFKPQPGKATSVPETLTPLW